MPGQGDRPRIDRMTYHASGRRANKLPAPYHTPLSYATRHSYLIRSGSLVFISVLLGVQLGAAILVRHSVSVIINGRFVRVGRLRASRLN